VCLLAAVAFVFRTASLATHAIGRAAVALGVPLFRGMTVNETPLREEGVSADPDP